MKKYTAPHLICDEYEFTVEAFASGDSSDPKNGHIHNQNCFQNDDCAGNVYWDKMTQYLCG